MKYNNNPPSNYNNNHMNININNNQKRHTKVVNYSHSPSPIPVHMPVSNYQPSSLKNNFTEGNIIGTGNSNINNISANVGNTNNNGLYKIPNANISANVNSNLNININMNMTNNNNVNNLNSQSNSNNLLSQTQQQNTYSYNQNIFNQNITQPIATKSSPIFNNNTSQGIKQKLLDKGAFPYTNQHLNLSQFASDNFQMYKGLIQEICNLKLKKSKITQACQALQSNYQQQQQRQQQSKNLSKNNNKNYYHLNTNYQTQSQAGDHNKSKNKMRVKSANKVSSQFLTKTKSGMLGNGGGSNLGSYQAQDYSPTLNNKNSLSSFWNNSNRENQNQNENENPSISIKNYKDTKNPFLKQQTNQLRLKSSKVSSAKNQLQANPITVYDQKNNRLLNSLVDDPQIQSKKQQLQKKSKIIEQLKIKNNTLKQAQKSGDLFQLYEIMCRQCQGLRNANDLLSQELKDVILKINSITGSQQNPNLFLMNIK